MGRRNKFEEKLVKRGSGAKARKQKPPTFKDFLDDDERKDLSRRQKTRIKKRASQKFQKIQQTHKKQPLFEINQDSDVKESDIDSEDSGCEVSQLNEDALSQLEGVQSSNVSEHFKKASGLLSSDEEGSEKSDEDEESDMSDVDSDDDLITKSKKILAQQRKVEEESKAELQAAQVAVDIPSLPEIFNDAELSADINTVNSRIKDVLFVLSDFRKRRKENVSRKDYVAILKHDLEKYYGYNRFLLDKFIKLFSVQELVDFLEANEIPRPLTIRTNTLKARRGMLSKSLSKEGVNLESITWSKVGLVIYSMQSTIGSTPEYLTGQYILQGASSFLPVVSLNPQEGERVLDMCAAPGGKSSHIAAMMRNTGVLVSNDFNEDRVKALIGNFHRMGVNNAIITNVHGRKCPDLLGCTMDRALVDAPCSGTGIVSKDASVKVTKSEADLTRLGQLQRELLLAAIDCVDANSKTGGVIVYSTCSILVEENEEVLNYAMKKRNVRLVSTELQMGQDGITRMGTKIYDSSLKLCKRIYPHLLNLDGFFVAKLKKFSNEIPGIPIASGQSDSTAKPAKGAKRPANLQVKKNNSKKQKLENGNEPNGSDDARKSLKKKKNKGVKKKKGKKKDTTFVKVKKGKKMNKRARRS